ncbi:MAG: AtpZ/AtpI family protein [Candidatus Zixiibacteriota bacterium]
MRLYISIQIFVVRNNNDKKEKAKLYRQLSLIGVIPAIMAVGPLIGYFVGHWLDRKFETEPYLMWVLILFGFIAAGKEVYRIVKQVSRESNEQ